MGQNGHHAAAGHAARRPDAGQGGAADPEGALSASSRSGTASARSCSATATRWRSARRNEKPMTRYFPEIVEAVRANLPETVRGRRRDHRRRSATGWSSRCCSSASTRPLAGSSCCREETPASFVAFDLLALDDDDYTQRPFAERRAALVEAWPARATHPSHPGDHAIRRRRAVVLPIRGRRAGRTGGQAARRRLPAGQAHHVQDQARANGRLRRRRLPRAQERPGPDRLAAARAVQGGRRRCQRRGDRRFPRWPGGRSCSRSCSRW